MKRVVDPPSRTGVAPVSDFEPEKGKYEPRISRISRMINGFHLRRVLLTHPARFAPKFLFIRVIRPALRDGFNFGSPS